MNSDYDALNIRRQNNLAPTDAVATPSSPRLPEKYWIVEYNLPPGFVRHSSADAQYFWARDFHVGYPNSFVKLSIHVLPEIDKNIIHLTVVDVEHDSTILHRSSVNLISKTSDWRQDLAQRLGLILVKANNKCRRNRQPLPPEYSFLSDALLPGFRYQPQTETEPAHWILHANRFSNLSVKVYPDLSGQIITVKLFYEQPSPGNHACTVAGGKEPSKEQIEIIKWTHEVSITGGDARWKTTLAERLGEASVQAKKQPKCPLCKKATVVRDAKYGQFFGCPSFPRCRGSLSIGSFQTELPQVYFEQKPQYGNQSTRAA